MVYLSFDIEEFDVPLENGVDISFSEQIRISTEGTLRILDILNKYKIKATFFCTAQYAKNAREIMKKIVNDGHELASHGYYHSNFEVSHLGESKEYLEALSGCNISGFRMARMMPVDELEIYKAVYLYNS